MKPLEARWFNLASRVKNLLQETNNIRKRNNNFSNSYRYTYVCFITRFKKFQSCLKLYEKKILFVFCHENIIFMKLFLNIPVSLSLLSFPFIIFFKSNVTRIIIQLF